MALRGRALCLADKEASEEMGQANARETKAERVSQAIVGKGTVTISNPLTGKPIETTPDGISLEGVTFPNKDAAWQFITEHWENPFEMADVSANAS